MTKTEMRLRAQEIRDHVAWFERQEMSLSSVEEFRARMMMVADGLQGAADREDGKVVPLAGFSRRVG